MLAKTFIVEYHKIINLDKRLRCFIVLIITSEMQMCEIPVNVNTDVCMYLSSGLRNL